jgi:hypothetical protein
MGCAYPAGGCHFDDGDWPLPIAWRALLADWLIANAATVSSTPPADLDNVGNGFGDGSIPCLWLSL